MRVNISLADDFIPKIDEKAKKFNLSRSSFISLCVSRQMQQEEMFDSMPVFLQVADKLKDVDFQQLKVVNK